MNWYMLLIVATSLLTIIVLPHVNLVPLVMLLCGVLLLITLIGYGTSILAMTFVILKRIVQG